MPLKTITIKFLILFLLVIIYASPISSAPAGKKEPVFKPDGIILHQDRCGYLGAEPSPEKILKKCHYYVRADGNVLQGVDEKTPVAHMLHRFNNRSFSVLLEGDFHRISPSGIPIIYKMPASQRESLKKLLFRMMKTHDIPLCQIERHCEYERSLSCPGNGFDYFGLLYEMSKEMISSAGKPLIEDICLDKKIPLPLTGAVIKIYKSKKILQLYQGNRLVKTYKIGLSRIPSGDKEKEGDLKTPEGTFVITEKYPMRGWMELSYPGKTHADRAFKNKTINAEEHGKILRAVQSGGISLHGTPLGDDVGIHAGGFPYGRMRTNSTAGCVSLEDPEAFELYFATPAGTKVIIYK